MAAAGENVVVVDGDLRRPTLVDVFDLVPGVGVTDVRTGTAELEDVLQPWGAMRNLSVLGSGRIPPNPSELLGSKAMRNMLSALAENAIVLIDAPPLLLVSTPRCSLAWRTGAVVVIRMCKTTQEQLAQLLGNLEKLKRPDPRRRPELRAEQRSGGLHVLRHLYVRPRSGIFN